MAFAHAVAAVFHILVSFAECLGASRLMDACSWFIDLCKGKYETGRWLEIEAAEAMSNRSDFSAMNASGIRLSSMANKQNESHGDLASEDNAKAAIDASAGDKTVTDATEERAIVLYKPDSHPPEANGSIAQEGNSKVQLLKVLETRKSVLQKEQGMAFAHAVAAGFDIDHMAPLVSFAECFGASRLMDACSRFVDLWKGKHETGWLEIEAAEAMSNRSDFSAINASGIMLSSMANKQNESHGDLASEDNGQAAIDASAEETRPMDHQVPVGQQGYFQGPFPHPLFPPWPVQSPPGALPVFQPYPVQGMPHLCNESQSASDSETDKEAGDFRVSAPDTMHKNSYFMPERGTEKMTTGCDPALDYEMQAHVEDAASLDNRNKEVVVDVKQGSKKSDKDRKSKVAPDALDKKTVGPIRKGKTSKMSPWDDARARAEKVRAFKADLQKMKKKKEEEYHKRLEALKMEREKRIAAKTAQLASSQKTRKQLPTKLALSSVKGTKFSDSEPGSSCPLQRSKIRAASTGSSESHKASKSNKSSNGSHLPGSRLTRPVLSLPEPWKENSDVTPDPKEEEYRKRLEALKMEREKRIAAKTAQLASSQKTRKQLPTKLALSSVKGTKFSDSEPGSSSPPQRSKTRTASTGSSESHKASKSNKSSHGSHLPRNRLTRPVSSLPEPRKENSDVTPDPKVPMARIRRLSEPKTVSSPYVAPVKSRRYLAPLARLSSLEDPCTDNSEYGKAPSTNLETAAMGLETAKAQVSGFENLKLEKIPEVLEKPQTNASSGMDVAELSKGTYMELQWKKVHRYVIFMIDEKKNEVVVEKTGSPAESYDDFAASLPENDCRYAVYDFDFVTSENCQKSKIFFIAWSPSVSRIRAKMLYATSKARFRRELEGIHYEIQVTDPTEMDLEVIRDRAN